MAEIGVANMLCWEEKVGPGNDPTRIAYLGHFGAGPWVENAKGVGLLAFLVPLE